jgi:hypothetical protein
LKATLAFVPPGGGEADYHLEFKLPGVTQPGDYISIARSPYASEGHRRKCDAYNSRVLQVENFDETAY